LAQNDLAFCYLFLINTHFGNENSAKKINATLADLDPERMKSGLHSLDIVTVRMQGQVSLSFS